MQYSKYLLFFSAVFSFSYSRADECVPYSLAQVEALDKNVVSHLTVGTISIDTEDIFDPSKPGEQTLLHKWANIIHIETKDSTVRQQLLFKEGDAFSVQKLQETERALRTNRYLKDVVVVPAMRCGNTINVAITTTDNWTLTPGVTFGRSGGNNHSGIEIQEHNLFGYGKSLALSYKKQTERNSTLLEYLDPQLFGTRKRLFLSFEDNSDGQGHTIDLSQPFYALDTHYAWGISSASFTQDNSVYENGNVTSKVTQKNDKHAIFYGWSKGLQGDHVSRFKAGWQYANNDFSAATNGSSQPLSIVESYPWLKYEYTQDKFTKRTNYKTMGKVEDVQLGLSYSTGLGILAEQFGSTDNQLLLTAQLNKGYELGKNDLGFLRFGVDSYLGNGILEGEKLSLEGEWYAFNETGNNWYVSGHLTEQSNLLPGEQVVLGGETGLRGYPTGFQSGDKSVLFTAERRFHYNWYPLHIAKFGAVVFADAGTAWGGDKAAKLRGDIGIGLRLVPTRSSSAKTLHLDLAIPLNDRASVDNYQFLIKTRNSF